MSELIQVLKRDSKVATALVNAIVRQADKASRFANRVGGDYAEGRRDQAEEILKIAGRITSKYYTKKS